MVPDRGVLLWWFKHLEWRCPGQRDFPKWSAVVGQVAFLEMLVCVKIVNQDKTKQILCVHRQNKIRLGAQMVFRLYERPVGHLKVVRAVVLRLSPACSADVCTSGF